MTPIRNVLVATDFSAASTRALELAVEIACRYGAKLTVLHTLENHSNSSACGIPPEIRRSAAFRLSEAVRPIAQHVPAVVGMLREGLAWHEITEGAKEAAADLVVIGSHGLGHGDRFLIGSVAEKVVRVCPVPVLTVHAWRFPDRTQAGRELAEMLLRSEEQVSKVIALSRGGAVVGAEVAEAFGTSLSILLTRALERDGHILGAVCEDGTVHLNGRRQQAAVDRPRGRRTRSRRIDRGGTPPGEPSLDGGWQGRYDGPRKRSDPGA